MVVKLLLHAESLAPEYQFMEYYGRQLAKNAKSLGAHPSACGCGATERLRHAGASSALRRTA
jgi:hypothetical protein